MFKAFQASLLKNQQDFKFYMELERGMAILPVTAVKVINMNTYLYSVEIEMGKDSFLYIYNDARVDLFHHVPNKLRYFEECYRVHPIGTLDIYYFAR